MNDNQNIGNRNIDLNTLNKTSQLFSNNNQIFNDNNSVNNVVSYIDNTNNIFNDNVEEDNVFFDTSYNNDSKIIKVEFTNKKGNNSKNKYNRIISMISSKNFSLVVILLIFIFTIINVGRSLYFKNILDNYEEFIIEIDNKYSNDTIVYNDNYVDNNDLVVKGGAFEELISCIRKPLSKEELPSSVNNIINEINNYYNSNINHFAFKYKDLYTGFSISYNEEHAIFVASTIKAPKDIYIYEMASLGKINLEDKLTYTSDYYNTGSGVLRNYGFNKEYSVKELLRYSTVISDNAAHNMLMDKYGRDNMLNFWKEKGTNTIFTQYSNWGVLNAHDAVIYMEELYNFYMNNKDYGEELMDNFLNATPKFININGVKRIANKSGWGGSAIHDVSIIFDENPYIVVGLSNLGNTNEYSSYFNKVGDFAHRLHNEYWKYKMDICGNINQY